MQEKFLPKIKSWAYDRRHCKEIDMKRRYLICTWCDRNPSFSLWTCFIRMEVILSLPYGSGKDKNKEDSWVESIALKEAMEHLQIENMILSNAILWRKNTNRVADEIAISQAQVSRLEKRLKHMKNHLVWFLLSYSICFFFKIYTAIKQTIKEKSRLPQTHMLSSQTAFQHHWRSYHTTRDHRWQFQNNRDRCQEFHNLIQVIINDRSKQRHRTSQDIMINISHLHRLFILNDDIFQQFFIFFIMSKANMFS